jgi:ferredoxin-NADP reductase/predicted pyridoxine 5'-phosphate oxidase superfamily flavin-nucleotide-binding protein
MSNAYRNVLFTPHVLAMQTRMGSRDLYESPDDLEAPGPDPLTRRERSFIAERDGFYQATVSETGWPYVQFRGGPAGFLKVLDAHTLGYADFRGNVQYISTGNLQTDDRVSIILMDYAEQRRLKLIGRARLVDVEQDSELMNKLQLPGYRARVERAVVISVEGFDWNCPQHITPRFTEEEMADINAPLLRQINDLKQKVHSLQDQPRAAVREDAGAALGDGPLALTIAGIRQLTPRVRAIQLQAADGSALPAFTPGAHIDVPVVLPDGSKTTRSYSLSSNPAQQDHYEIAVLRVPDGHGGSNAVHDSLRLGMTLRTSLPKNDFQLHTDERPAVLIAGGIGITPLRAMAMQLKDAGRSFHLHYAARAASEATYLPELRRELPGALSVYLGEAGQRLDVGSVIRDAPADAVFYVCGPASLIDAVRGAAQAAGIGDDYIRTERFTAAPLSADERPITVHLQRSGKTIEVSRTESILDAVEAAGIDAPSSCRTGTCGTCAVKVLAGEVDHRDSVLSDAERERAALMTICVSRARSEALTLDL